MQSLLKASIAVGLLAAAGTSFAQVTLFNSPDTTSNAATRTNWLTAAGVAAPDVMQDFESFSVGTNLSGVSLPGGMTITNTSNNSALVQSSSAFFGGSLPFGTNGLAAAENRVFEFTFTSPLTYLGLYEMDSSGTDYRVFLADNTFVDFNDLDPTASSGQSGEFVGFVTTGPAIVAMRVNTSGGDGEMGFDEVQFGAVPEPATMAALGLGLAALLRRRAR